MHFYRDIPYRFSKISNIYSMSNQNIKNHPMKRLLTVKEAAIYIGRSVPAVRELIWAGKLPIIRPDRRISLDINDLDRWIEQHKTTYTY